MERELTMNTQTIRIETNRHPVYCRECRSQDTFERNPDMDIKTESGRAYMLSYKCRLCGHTALMSSPDYKPPIAEVV